MKRRIALSIALAFSVLVSLVSLPAAAQGQQTQRFRADTGVVPTGLDQILRVTVAPIEIDKSSPPLLVRFRRMQYVAEGCNSDGLCRQTVATQSVTAPMTLNPNESASIDVQGTGAGVRVVVETSSPNARLLGVVFDTFTKRIVAICTFIPD